MYLFKFEDRCKTVDLTPQSTIADVKNKFRQAFKYYGTVNISAWNEFWDEWIDIATDGDLQEGLAKGKMKIKFSRSEKCGYGNLSADSTAVFCCDMQKRFAPVIQHFADIVTVGARVLKAAEILNIPLVVSEQYPKGLLNTVDELDISRASLVAEKTKFSMVIPQVEEFLESNPNITSVVLFGVEAHVCVQQTVIDLHSRGVEVHVVADATSSRSLIDRHMSYLRFVRLGAFVSVAESILFQFIADKNHPDFKAIQGIIKTLPPDTGLSSFKSNI